MRDAKKELAQPHDIYKDAEYHTLKGNKPKSPRPIDGQHALNNSLPIKATTKRRIAISNGEFVVLDQTSPGIFHGHVRTLEDFNYF